MNEIEMARNKLISILDQRQAAMIDAMKLMPQESIGTILHLLTEMSEDEFHVTCASSMEITKFLRSFALVTMCDILAKMGERDYFPS